MKSQTARYLVRLAIMDFKPHPSDARSLLHEIQILLAPFSVEAMNLRVSSRAIEFDVFSSPSLAPEQWISCLEKRGTLLTCRRLDLQEPVIDSVQAITEAKRLWNEERFWEVHEVLEDVWKKEKSPQKEWLQSIILSAAALVHAQKNEQDVVWPMLSQALKLMDQLPSVHWGFSFENLKNWIKNTLNSQTIKVKQV